MEIRKLKSEIIAKIRSSSTLSNVTQCVTELVLNSLDAKSTAIAIRINLVTFRLQIVDNGEGITKENLRLLGPRYMTNKCNSLDELEKQVKHYGFRGETLASIADLSKSVEITSKYVHSSETYSKVLGNHTGDDIKLVRNRPSCGTTVTVEGFLYNLPVRKKRFVPELELEDIKKSIEYLVIIHPKVSFSIRNDLTGNLILNCKKSKDIISSFKSLHPQMDADFSIMKVSKLKVTVEALLFKGLFESKSLQYVYVNKRPVYCSKIQKFVINLYYKNQKHERKSSDNLIANRKNKYPAYVINVKCPHSNVDILLNPSKTMVEFKNWNIVLRCLEKLINSFFGTAEKVKSDRYLTAAKDRKSDCGVSQMCGAYKAYGYKRHVTEKGNFIPEKVPKRNRENIFSSGIIEETQFSAGDSKIVQRREEYPRFNDISFQSKLFKENTKVLNNAGDKKNLENSDNSEILFSDISMDLGKDKSMRVEKISKKPIKSAIKVKCTQHKQDIPSLPNDIYSISNFTSPTKSKVKKFKKPLPIKVSHKNKNVNNSPEVEKKKFQYSDMNISPYNNGNENHLKNREYFTNHVLDMNNYQNIADDEKSLFSKYTDDENKGKNLIMDMFLKSTQVYNSEEEIQSDAKSEETIFEVQSNFLMENNIQTKVNGVSKTMSVSVNIKSMKKIKKQKSKVEKKTSRGVQTSFDSTNMTSKCVQTSINQNGVKSSNPLPPQRERHFNTTKLAENYTVILSDTIRSKNDPCFKIFGDAFLNMARENLNFTADCKCGCHVKKVFNFENLKCRENGNSPSKKTILQTRNLSKSHLEVNNMGPVGSHDGEIYENFNFGIGRTIPLELHPRAVKDYQALKKFWNFSNHHHKEDWFLPKNTFNEAHLLMNANAKGGLQRNNWCDKSPYFLPKNQRGNKCNLFNADVYNMKTNFPAKTCNKVNKHSFYELFNPHFQSTQRSHTNKNCNKEYPPSNNFTIDNFVQFQPLFKSTQYDTKNDFSCHFIPPETYNDNVANRVGFDNNLCVNSFNDYEHKIPQNDVHENEEFEIQNDFTLDTWSKFPGDGFKSNTDLMNVSEYFQGNGGENIFSPNKLITNDSITQRQKSYRNQANKRTGGELSKLVITLSNNQKRNILEKELDAKKGLNERKFLDWDSQVVAVDREEPKEFDNEWIKKINKFGSSFYINKRTGFTTFSTPKPNSNPFTLGKRFEFMPKGLSPIMKDFKAVDRSLSQNKKELLQNYILESHQDDLLIVKWQNYIKNKDPKKFFEEVYRHKVKEYEDCIPNINNAGNRKCIGQENEVISFDKVLFDNITVVGQVDKKFIAVLEQTKNLIILFDQHAVHERVRLEELLRAYKGAKIECEEKFILFIPQNDLSILRKQELYLNSLGLSVEFFENGIAVSEVPLCLYRKFKSSNPKDCLNKVVQQLINEIIQLLKTTRGVSLKNLPPIIQDIINLEACRGAIKFGDSLKITVCMELLQKLSDCKLPFQCAHGRPTLVPLLMLNSTRKSEPSRINFEKLLKKK